AGHRCSGRRCRRPAALLVGIARPPLARRGRALSRMGHRVVSIGRPAGPEAKMANLEQFTARARLMAIAALSAGLALAGCRKGSSSGSNSVTVAGAVPVAYAMRANTIETNPLSGAPTAPGGDLIIREKSSPSAPEHNITGAYTQGKGDVTDPDVSY